jgi:hypothetical protein
MPRPSENLETRNGHGPAADAGRLPRPRPPEPDVYLNVPDLHVDKIHLGVEHLDAHLALQARLGNLLELRAGADVTIHKVELDIEGVAAKATLKVRLENVQAIIDRALTSIDRNPEILQGVIETADDAVRPGGLLASAVDDLHRSLGSRHRGRKLSHAGKSGMVRLRRGVARLTGR